jgi:hypothetical protein
MSPCHIGFSYVWNRNCIKGAAEKPIFWAKPAHFDFVAINFTYCLESHTEHTVGDILLGAIKILPKTLQPGTNPTHEMDLRDFLYV